MKFRFRLHRKKWMLPMTRKVYWVDYYEVDSVKEALEQWEKEVIELIEKGSLKDHKDYYTMIQKVKE